MGKTFQFTWFNLLNVEKFSWQAACQLKFSTLVVFKQIALPTKMKIVKFTLENKLFWCGYAYEI